MLKGKAKRSLAFVLAACMLLALLPSFGAGASAANVSYTEVDPSVIDTGTAVLPEAEQDAEQDVPAADEEVHVIILFEQKSLAKKGFSTKDLLENEKAASYSSSLKKQQLSLVDRIEREALGGEKLEIRYSSQPKYPGKAVITSGKQLLCQVLPIKYPAEFFSAIDAARDDFLDFAEDYEPVRKFFTGDQIGIFDRAIRLMKIFDDSKTFIVNDEVENTVGQIKVIMQKPAPYSDIFKLPALLDQYIRAYDEVLQTMEEPVLAAIEDAKSRVFAELEGKESKPQFMGKFAAKFQELHDKATSSNNVATLQNIKVEADALKVRCLNEISDAETKILARKAAEQAQRRAQADAAQTASGKRPETPTPQPAPEPPKPKIKKQKTVSIKSINTSNTWQLESADDVRRYVSELQDKLMRALEKDTVINIEF